MGNMEIEPKGDTTGGIIKSLDTAAVEVSANIR